MLLAPQLQIQPRDLCVMELQLIQTLQFNLFIPTSVEFAHAFISRLGAACCEVGDQFGEILIEPMHAWVTKFTKYFEADFTALEFRQSEKVYQFSLLSHSLSLSLSLSNLFPPDIIFYFSRFFRLSPWFNAR